jgi:hypothetical protein
MDIMGRLSNPQVLEGWLRLVKIPVQQRPEGVRPQKPADGARPYKAVRRLVIQALERADRPIMPAEVRRMIEAATGESVPASSVKYCLWSGSQQTKGTFRRETGGYRLRAALHRERDRLR